jgi:muramoyltetrapeptide carboxypeptidase
MSQIPPYLKPGDTIGMVCPAGYMATESTVQCRQTLEQWGFRVKTGKTIGGKSDNYFSGTDDERLEDLQAMLDDGSVKAILFGRGGYGIGRIIERISFRRFRRSPKWILGYSDITLLHAHIRANYDIATAHSPMAAAFNDPLQPNPYTQSIYELLTGRKMVYHGNGHTLNRKGEAEGVLVGGNLTLLAHAIGTSSEVKTRDCLLFIEDIGEYLYNIDRMLYQLKRANRLHKPAGMIIGSFTDCKDTERPFGKTAYEIIRDVLSEYDYPVCYGFPVGHETANYALKCGVKHRLKVGEGQVVLKEVR